MSGNSIDQFTELCEFVKCFNIHYQLLLRRYERFKEIDTIHNTDIDVITYLDIIVVQLRAMCIENVSYEKNYTAQNLLRKIGEEKLAQQIDAMLDEEFYEDVMDMTVRKAIKILADKLICHYDSFNDKNNNLFSMSSIIEQQLRSPYNNHNLDYIMNTLIRCIEKGLRIKEE